MKKFALFIMLCIYTLSSLGIGVNSFYCCGILKSTGLTLGQSFTDGCSKGNEKNGCCNNKFKSLQIKESHIASDTFTTTEQLYTILHLANPALQVLIIAIPTMGISYSTHAPPLRQQIPFYISYCVYRV